MRVRSTVWILLIAVVAASVFGVWMWRVSMVSVPDHSAISSAPRDAVANPSAASGSPSVPRRVTRGTSSGAMEEPTPIRAESPPRRARTLAETVAYLGDEKAPTEDRHAALERLGQREDPETVNAVIGVAEAAPTLREHAVMLLGRHKSDLVAGFLATQLTNEDERVVCGAVSGLGHIKGVDAIPAIGAVAENNRSRAGGPSDAVWASCATVLGEIRSSEALPVLERELKWVCEGVPNLVRFEYGSKLVAALEHIGDSRAAEMLQSYANQMQSSLSGIPTVRQAQMVKIMEARKAAEGLK